MHNPRNALFSNAVVVAIAWCAVAWPQSAALAQNANGPTAPSISTTDAPAYAAYYAPYAIHAAAAYKPILPVAGNPNEPGLDSLIGKRVHDVYRKGDSYGADVAYVVRIGAEEFGDKDTARQASDLLRPWHYTFGHEGYLDCLDKNDRQCQAAYERSKSTLFHAQSLAFQVWIRRNARFSCVEASIAFRGTEIGSLSDWISNLHQVDGAITDDEYDQLGRNINAILRKIRSMGCYGAQTQVVSVGHSLGGGLAQFAALARSGDAPRITKVFAFNTSPVTATTRIAPGTLKANSRGLTIDRVRQQGEILSTYLSWDQQYPASTSACDPVVRTVAVDAFQPPPPTTRAMRVLNAVRPNLYRAIALHGIVPLAGRLAQWSYDGDSQLVPSKIPSIDYACWTDYRNPPQPRIYIGTPVAKVGGGAGRRPVATNGARAFASARVRKLQ